LWQRLKLWLLTQQLTLKQRKPAPSQQPKHQPRNNLNFLFKVQNYFLMLKAHFGGLFFAPIIYP
jgi:FPC/CPF motif-containing protein YcgG